MRKQFGFTLTEMMVTIVILGIIVGVAFPAYKNQVSSTRRSAAAGCLNEYAQFMERVYTTNLTYASNNGAALSSLPVTNCSKNLSGLYTFTFNKDVSTFTISAAPAGGQIGDACGVLTINQLGDRTANGASDDAAIRRCW
jgi:type IV pilus assembly protein PilE